MVFQRGRSVSRAKCPWVIVAVVLILLVNGIAEAEGIRDKLKRVARGGGSEEHPTVVLSDDDYSGAQSDSKKTGTKTVLLVSVPKNEANIEEESAIAFIDFKHIEHDIPSNLKERKIFSISEVETEEGGQDVRRKVEEEGYSSEICARQVEAALGQHLADLNIFKVVTRDHIKTVLDEIKFSYSGSVNSTTAAKLGNLTGAKTLLYGQVQLCASSRKDYEMLSNLALRVGHMAGEGGNGWLGNLVGAVKEIVPEKIRAFVLAQVQLIDAETGKRVFTASLRGEFEGKRGALAYQMSHRELIYRAAEDLANNFIDDLLARQEAQYIDLYSDERFGFRKGIDLIQLGDCSRAEIYFRNTYLQHGKSMNERETSRLMYNHGIALMCANRPNESLDRLWASLRLMNEQRTFDAISFTNDTVDRGRVIVQESDSIIRDVREVRFPRVLGAPSSGE